MRRIVQATLLTTSILAGAAIGLSTTASALTPEEIASIYSEAYNVVSVEPSATDPSVYEMTVLVDGVETILLVDAETGEIIAAEEPGPDDGVAGGDGAEGTEVADREECMDGGWVTLEFRNQGQCIRYVNTGVDTRPWEHPRAADDGEGEEADARDACRNGGWEDLGYRNQGQCLADL
jgi:hypothetical protein